MKWFKHFSNAKYDTKIRRLVKKYGLRGYGLYFAIIESIAFELETNSPIPEIEDNAQDIAEYFNEDTVMIEEIMNYALEQKLFEYNPDTKRIMCLKLLTHLDNTMSSNPEIKKILNNFKKLEETLRNSKQIRLDEIRLEEIRLDKNRIDKIKKEKKPENEELKAKRQGLIDFFCNNYFEIYGVKLDITKKEIGCIEKLLKKDPAELKRKMDILYNLCKSAKNDFYKFTPSKLLYLWNDLTGKKNNSKSWEEIDEELEKRRVK